MGIHANIAHNKFPLQSELVGCKVKVCYHFDVTHQEDGLIVRDDIEAPWIMIIRVGDPGVQGRYVLASECQYTFFVGV